MASANVLPILDTSYSMTSSGYVTITKTDSEAFVRSARPGDRIGVVSYDDSGRVTYPPGGSALVEVDFSLKQTREAAAAIEALVFEGSCTNIAAGIAVGRTLMDPQPSPKGMVLLSDGYWNCGNNPLQNLPPYAIYSCAMGPYSDQQLMQQIAANTGGQYYFAPTPFQMTLIFNQIRGELSPAALVALNEQQPLAAGTQLAVTADIGPSTDGLQFSFVWNDPSLLYTKDTPQPGQIQVALWVPETGAQWPAEPDVIGPGYVIWNIPSTTPGQWQISAQYAAGATTKEVMTTAGALEFGSDTTLQVEREQDAQGVRLSVSLVSGGEAVSEQQVTVEVVRAEPVQDAVARLRTELGTVVVPDTVKDVPPQVAQLLALAIRRGRDVVETRSETLTDDGSHRWQVPFDGASSMTFRAVAKGRNADGVAIQRTSIFSVYRGAVA